MEQAFGLEDFRITASTMYGRRGPVATASFGGGEEGESQTIALGDDVVYQTSIEAVKPLYTGGAIERTQKVAMAALETRKLSADVVARALDLAARRAVYGEIGRAHV